MMGRGVFGAGLGNLFVIRIELINEQNIGNILQLSFSRLPLLGFENGGGVTREQSTVAD